MSLNHNPGSDNMSINPGNTTIREFEYKLSDYYKTKYVLSVCNATIGILGVFYALGLNDCEIITTPLTWSGALSGPKMLNCSFRFCDVEPETLTINPDLLESKITKKTKAVFTADFLGYPAKLDKIKKICQKHNLLLIHDAASSFGSSYKGHFPGYFADVTITSFGQKKIFSIGEGGCIITRQKKHYEKLANLIMHPERQTKEFGFINPFALNTSINPFAAKLGIETMDKRIIEIENRRKKIEIRLQEMGLNNLDMEFKPNYYKILISSQIPNLNIIKSSLKPLPFKDVIYNEWGAKKTSSTGDLCPNAEMAIEKYEILDLNIII